jgi:hypothetical protein
VYAGGGAYAGGDGLLTVVGETSVEWPLLLLLLLDV